MLSGVGGVACRVDTICALSTPSGRGGISVIRLSGPRAWAISRLLSPDLPLKIESHRAYRASFLDPSTQPIDDGLILFFSQGSSYTGDETAELNCHGNPLIVDELLRRLVELGCRPAGRGEFTMRAFMNGRMDLTQAEGVLGLIESESTVGRRVSLRQLKGELSEAFLKIENLLVHVLAHIEAAIDFSTEDIEVVDFEVMRKNLQQILVLVDPLLATFSQGRKINQGFIVALVGEPNSGKSSLLNAFLSDDRAIVSPIAGTTRDVVEASLRLGGRIIHFRDTAGLRETQDSVEAEGIRRSMRAAAEADLVFLVIDQARPDAIRDGALQLSELRRQLPAGEVMILLNKSDLSSLAPSIDISLLGMGADRVFPVSAITKAGLAEVLARIEGASQLEFSAELAVLTSARHFEGLKKVQLAVKDADLGISAGHSSDIVALDLREALFAIQLLLGKQFEESVIDRIFSDFCIGK